MKCSICEQEGEPYGPRDREVCLSCWLESGGDDDVIRGADTREDLKDTREYYAEMRALAKELFCTVEKAKWAHQTWNFFHCHGE